MKILITSGGTKVPIDRVRSITNMSKGTFGSRIADAFYALGCNNIGKQNKEQIEKITFFMAKGSKMPFVDKHIMCEIHAAAGLVPVEMIEYSTFDDYKTGVEKLLSREKYDIIVVAAAVSDYGVANYYNGKYRSREDDMCIKLVKLPKILPIMRKMAPDSVICGFKLLVDSTTAELLNAMKNQIVESDVDLVIGNDLRDIKNDNHILTVMSKYNHVPREYSLLPPEERKQFAVYPLAKAVVNECIEAYEQRKQNNGKDRNN